jgi:hypothetical protein
MYVCHLFRVVGCVNKLVLDCHVPLVVGFGKEGKNPIILNCSYGVATASWGVAFVVIGSLPSIPPRAAASWGAAYAAFVVIASSACVGPLAVASWGAAFFIAMVAPCCLPREVGEAFVVITLSPPQSNGAGVVDVLPDQLNPQAQQPAN